MDIKKPIYRSLKAKNNKSVDFFNMLKLTVYIKPQNKHDNLLIYIISYKSERLAVPRNFYLLSVIYYLLSEKGKYRRMK